ncbi:hypothetical protein [Persephonella sp.]
MIDKKYFLYLFFVVLITFNISILIISKTIEEANYNKKRELLTLKMEIDNLSKNLEKILKLKEDLGLEYIDKKKAESIIINSLEDLKRNFNVKIIGGIKSDGRSVYATVNFEMKPKSSISLIKTLNSFEKSIYPVYMINMFDLSNNERGATVNMTVTIKQPYLGVR